MIYNIKNLNYEKYHNPIDVASIFMSYKKLEVFIDFMIEDLEQNYIRQFERNEIPMLPVVISSTRRTDISYISVDYNYLIQTIARFMKRFELGNYEQFVDDFRINSAEENKVNSVFLTSTILQEMLKVAYINNFNDRKASLFYRRYCHQILFQNDKATVEFGSVMLVVNDLLEVIDNHLVARLNEIAQMSNAKQIAFAAKEIKTFRIENKSTDILRIMSNRDINY